MLVACTHSDAFTTPPIAALGPISAGPDVQLTFNLDQDYWPAWTQDGRGILYSFVNAGSTASHRCLGILPAAGGSRLWEMCDNRAVRNDTVSSYSAFALDSTGRLLVVEAVSRSGFLSLSPNHIRILLTDTAAPYSRTTLDTIPISGDSIGGKTTVSWLNDLAWTGTNSFIAYGGQFATMSTGNVCGPFVCQDSTFRQNGVVVTGTIANGKATLRSVPGTDSAHAYSLAEGGATIVFVAADYPGKLLTVPLSGGQPTVVATLYSGLNGNANRVSCRGETCIVAATIGGSLPELLSVALQTGVVTVLRTTGGLAETVGVSPATHDVIVQLGSNLVLYQGILP